MTRRNPLIEALDRAGYRITAPRRTVAALIAAQDGHCTAADLAGEARARRLEVGRATIFRALDLFLSLKLVERVDLPDGDHAYVACDPVHHHHAICTECGRSLDVDDAAPGDVLTAIGPRLGLVGVCESCQAAAGS